MPGIGGGAMYAVWSRTRQGNRFRAFTLIELMVAVSIIGLICMLTAAAVQRVREAARRLSCTNNLKQIALSVQNYAALHARFPPIDCETKLGASPVPFSAHAFSAHARILDSMERQSEYNAINFTQIPWTASGLGDNQTVMRLAIGTFLCPSDGQTEVTGYGRCNYRFNIGPTHRIAPGRAYPESYQGPFNVHRNYTPADFLDGLSNTVGISERLQGDWVKGVFKQSGDYLLGPVDEIGSVRTSNDAVALCSSNRGTDPHESRAGESWFLTGFHFTNYNHCLPPNSRLNDCALDDWTEGIHLRAEHQGVFTASSYHGGGVNAALMDGSVRFVGDGIDRNVWRAVGTKASGEVVSEW